MQLSPQETQTLSNGRLSIFCFFCASSSLRRFPRQGPHVSTAKITPQGISNEKLTMALTFGLYSFFRANLFLRGRFC
jgi:hypothetical protein